MRRQPWHSAPCVRLRIQRIQIQRYSKINDIKHAIENLLKIIEGVPVHTLHGLCGVDRPTAHLERKVGVRTRKTCKKLHSLTWLFDCELPVHWDEQEADMFLDTSQKQLKSYSYPATYTRPLPPNHLWRKKRICRKEQHVRSAMLFRLGDESRLWWQISRVKVPHSAFFFYLLRNV